MATSTRRRSSNGSTSPDPKLEARGSELQPFGTLRTLPIGLPDDAIALIADQAYSARSPRSYVAMFHLGGAVARVPRDETAYAGRDVAHNIVIDGVWLPGEAGEHAAAETAWVRRYFDALRPHRADGVYVNFLDADDDSSRVLEAYGERIYRRLAAVKAEYDPDNVFHHNKNIRPRGGAG